VRAAHFILFPRLVTIIVSRYFPLPGVCSQAAKTAPLPPAFTPPRAIIQLSGLCRSSGSAAEPVNPRGRFNESP